MVVYVVFSMGDMIMFNRRRKAEYYEAKQKRNLEALRVSLKAMAEGNANIKQRVLLKRYELVKRAEDERIQNRGVIAKGLDWAFPGIMGRQTEARLVMKLDDELVKALETGELDRLVEEESLEQSGSVQTQQGTVVHREGGSLDQNAQHIVDAAQKSTKSWASWIGWR
jgi:hypothetical protein